jgi:serine/threonine protein kinase
VVTSPPNTAGLPGGLRPLAEHCLAKDPRQRPTAAQLLAGLSQNPPERVQTSSRPELHPAYDEQPTHTQRASDRLAAEPESRFDRPAASPVPPWDSRPAAPPRRRPARRGWLIAAAAAAVLASVGAGAFVAGKIGPGHGGAPPASGSTSPAGATSPVTSPAASTQLPGAAAMATLGSYLARSASVRPTIQAAVNGVQGCSESPESGEATLQHAIDTRQDILNALPTLSVSELPSGTQLVSTLTTTMQDSIAADKDYQSWTKDLASSGSPCGSDPRQDPHYAAAVNVSGAATTAKNAFVAIWDPMAPRYGQPVYSSTGF